MIIHEFGFELCTQPKPNIGTGRLGSEDENPEYEDPGDGPGGDLTAGDVIFFGGARRCNGRRIVKIVKKEGARGECH